MFRCRLTMMLPQGVKVFLFLFGGKVPAINMMQKEKADLKLRKTINNDSVVLTYDHQNNKKLEYSR